MGCVARWPALATIEETEAACFQAHLRSADGALDVVLDRLGGNANCTALNGLVHGVILFSMDSNDTGPERLSGAPGMRGPGHTVTAREAKQRRVTLANLMCDGLNDDELVETMQGAFQMTEDEVLRLRDKVRAQLSAEFDENSVIHKAMASRRIHRHIQEARKARQWGAVANLESQLSKIQGTESPTEQHITVDAKLQQATLTMLGGMTPAQVQELIAEELKRLPPTSTPSLPSQAAPVVVQTEPDPG
jgi:hypothetical protein